jgi:hypothetical protein
VRLSLKTLLQSLLKLSEQAHIPTTHQKADHQNTILTLDSFYTKVMALLGNDIQINVTSLQY